MESPLILSFSQWEKARPNNRGGSSRVPFPIDIRLRIGMPPRGKLAKAIGNLAVIPRTDGVKNAPMRFRGYDSKASRQQFRRLT